MPEGLGQRPPQQETKASTSASTEISKSFLARSKAALESNPMVGKTAKVAVMGSLAGIVISNSVARGDWVSAAIAGGAYVYASTRTIVR